MNIDPTKTVNELVTVLPYVIDIDEKKKIYHSWRVAVITAMTSYGRVSGLQLKYIFYAALLHDIGGLGFPIHIIHYLKRTDKTARQVLLSHPIIGAQLVSNIPCLGPAAKIIIDHHEWINGMGYPRAKIKKDIPYGSQTIRIADSMDILFQLKGISRFKELKEKMMINLNREYSRALLLRSLERISKRRIFSRIFSAGCIEAIFKETHKEVGPVKIPMKIDAIGKTLEVVAQVIDMKHPFTSGHSLRVSRYALAISLSMGLAHDEITKIRWAGLIHDIGKLTVPRRILDTPIGLKPKEYQEIQKHAVQTYKIMNLISSLYEITPIAAAHHERFDGRGYPFGLKGNQIPLGARILSICDAFDAMTSNRPYRRPMTYEEACLEIKTLSGKQFDPEIVEIALPLLKNLGF